MPMYTYHCENCDHQFEKYQSFSEDALTICPNCQKETLYKVYKPALVLFKGSGFYVTDSKSHNPTMDVPPSSDTNNNNNNHNHDHGHSHDHKTADAPKAEKSETKKDAKKDAKSNNKSEAKK